MFSKKIIIEVTAETAEALDAKVQSLLNDPSVKQPKQDFWVGQGDVDYLEDVVADGYAQHHLAMTPIRRDKHRPNALPVYIGEFGVALGQVQHRQSITPPEAFSELASSGAWSDWLRTIACSSTAHGERKALVQRVRTLVEQCAFDQRSNAEVIFEEQLRNGEWNNVNVSLPAVYEDVRILVDGIVRIARLGHDRSHFQFAHYMGNAKYQYCASLERVQGWQSLSGIPAKPIEAALANV